MTKNYGSQEKGGGVSTFVNLFSYIIDNIFIDTFTGMFCQAIKTTNALCNLVFSELKHFDQVTVFFQGTDDLVFQIF